MRLPSNNIRDLCVKFRDAFYGKDSDRKLYVLPYNRFDIDSVRNWWWISPVHVSPAYQYGKFLFCIDDDKIFAGFHVEKGLSEAFNIPKTPYNGMGMDDSWQWHTFIKDMESGKISDALDIIREKSGVDPIVHLSYFDVRMESITKQYEFIYVGRSQIQPEKGDWDKISHCVNLKDLSQVLQQIGSDENTYFDATIGLRFGMTGSDDTEWTLADLQEKLMQHLEQWVVGDIDKG